MQKQRVVVLLCALITSAACAQEKIAVGEKFPAFQADELFSAKPLTLADVRGKIVAIHFWDSGDKESRLDIETLLTAYSNFNKKGFDVISISLEERKTRPRRIAMEKGIKWHMVAEGGGRQTRLAQELGVSTVPRTFLLDPEGVVIGIDQRGPALLTAIEEAMKKTPPLELKDPQAVAQARYESAASLYEAKEYADAADEFEAIVQRFPETAAGKLAQEKIATMKADPQLAEALAKARIERESRKDTRRAQRLLEMARSLHQSGNNAAARDYYNRVIKNFAGTKEAERAVEELSKIPE